MTVAVAVQVLPRRIAGWAASRSLAPNSLTGIGLACSICAAVWFSAGTRLAALAGGLALCGGYLARRVCRQLAAAPPDGTAVRAGIAAAYAARAAAGPAGAIRAGTVSADAARAVAGPARAAAALRPVPFDGWLAGACAAAGEFAVYAGLAAGAPPGQRHGIWLLAAGAAVLLTLGRTARICQPARPDAGRTSSPAAAAAGRLLALPTGERTAVITVTALAWGPRVTFLTLIGWGVVALAWAATRAAGASPAALVACRDDGAFARAVGRVVQGQVVPLPPALAGLVATGLLAALDLRNLSGILLLTPVAAMALAAPGSSHPHDGRLDRLVPLVLQAGEYVYLIALGFSLDVPGPLTFGLVGVTALHHLDVAYRARHQMPRPGPAPRLGWEGRMMTAGLGALFGITAFAYLMLTAYLGLLLCWGSLLGWLAVREGDRR